MIESSQVQGNPAPAWHNRAADLATWAWDRLHNRDDVWGAYRPLADRGKTYLDKAGTETKLGNSWTAPRKAERGQVCLTLDVLTRHFAATAPGHVIGLHTTSPSNTSLWGAVEVDWHGETSTPADINLAAALAWHDALRNMGFNPLLTDSNGRGGFHLLTVFSQQVATARVFGFLKWLTRNHAQLGLPKPPETFPKQPRIDAGRYGNWLRVPGRHHSREQWSRVWDGSVWLEGAPAVDFVLALQGDDPARIPADAAAFSAQPSPPPAQAIHTTFADTGQLAGRVRKYLDKLPTGLGVGQHRDDYAFSFACFLSRDLALSDDVCMAWLAEFDRRQAAQKGETRLKEILDNARKYGKCPVGCGLNAPRPGGRHGHVILTSRVEVG
jgi:hypothetical protein